MKEYYVKRTNIGTYALMKRRFLFDRIVKVFDTEELADGACYFFNGGLYTSEPNAYLVCGENHFDVFIGHGDASFLVKSFIFQDGDMEYARNLAEELTDKINETNLL